MFWKLFFAFLSFETWQAGGVESYFGQNDDSDQPGGSDGPVNSRQRLQEYDPILYGLVHEVFPCGNAYIDRCITKDGKQCDLKVSWCFSYLVLF